MADYFRETCKIVENFDYSAVVAAETQPPNYGGLLFSILKARAAPQC